MFGIEETKLRVIYNIIVRDYLLHIESGVEFDEGLGCDGGRGVSIG